MSASISTSNQQLQYIHNIINTSITVLCHPVIAGLILGTIIYLIIKSFFQSSWTLFQQYPTPQQLQLKQQQLQLQQHNQQIQAQTNYLTYSQLVYYNGMKHEQYNPLAKIYISIDFTIYDVTHATNFYGPGAAYHILTGHDATLCLAYGELKQELLNPNSKQDTRLLHLSKSHIQTLQDWKQRFESKYNIVGYVKLDEHNHDQQIEENKSSNHADVKDDQNNVETTVAADSSSSSSSSSSMKCPYAAIANQDNQNQAYNKNNILDPFPAHIYQQLPIYTLQSLSIYNGTQAQVQYAIYVAVQGYVFDVSTGRDEVYGQGNTYQYLAGTDASYALVMQSYEEKDANQSISHFTPQQQAQLHKLVKQFANKYPIVGRIDFSYTPSAIKSFSLDELSQFSASAVSTRQNENHPSEPVLISVKGNVYDVNGAVDFSLEGRYHSLTGHDASLALALSSLDPTLFNQPFDHLNYDQAIVLETWQRRFDGLFPLVGLVVGWQPADALRQSSGPKLFTTNLHSHVDQGDFDCIKSALEQDPSQVNQVCPRTGLTPLHKVVEQGRLDLVDLLLQHGADINAPAPLYDNETCLDMAKRFGQSDIIEALVNGKASKQ